MLIEKRCTLVLCKPDAVDRCGCRYEAAHSVHHNVTESEAYALVMSLAVRRDPDDIDADYYLFDASPDRSDQFDWYNRLRVEVPEKRKQLHEEKARAAQEALTERTKKEIQAREILDRAEYERLKHKFEGGQS